MIISNQIKAISIPTRTRTDEQYGYGKKKKM